MSETTDETIVPKSKDDVKPDEPAGAEVVEDNEKSTSEKLADRMMSVIESQSKTQAGQFTEQANQNKRMMILVGIALGVVAILLAGVVGVGIQLDFFGFEGSTTGTPPVAAHVDVESDGVPGEASVGEPLSPVDPDVATHGEVPSPSSPYREPSLEEELIRRELETLEALEQYMRDSAPY